MKLQLKKLSIDYQNECLARDKNANQAVETATIAEIRDLKYKIQCIEAVTYYVRSTIFSNWVYNNLGKLKESDIKEDMSSIYEKEFDTKGSKEFGDEYKNAFYKFKTHNNNIFVKDEDPEGDSNFANHRQMVIRNSIQYNLIRSFSTYNSMSIKDYTFEVPILKILIGIN